MDFSDALPGLSPTLSGDGLSLASVEFGDISVRSADTLVRFHFNLSANYTTQRIVLFDPALLLRSLAPTLLICPLSLIHLPNTPYCCSLLPLYARRR